MVGDINWHGTQRQKKRNIHYSNGHFVSPVNLLPEKSTISRIWLSHSRTLPCVLDPSLSLFLLNRTNLTREEQTEKKRQNVESMVIRRNFSGKSLFVGTFHFMVFRWNFFLRKILIRKKVPLANNFPKIL